MRESGRGDYSQHNQIRRHRIEDMEMEMIHQTMPGDCVLINYLNTESLFNGDGKIIMSPRELRDMVIEARRRNGENTSDIEQDNTPLSYKDTVRLFSTINGIPAKQEDIVTVKGDIARNDLRNNIEHGLLEYFDGYTSGLCSTGMGYHSRTIWKLSENKFIVIDPMNPEGFASLSKNQLVEYLINLCANQPAENNFFFFLRSSED